MTRRFAIPVGLSLGVVVALGMMAVAARTAPDRSPHGRPIGPALAPDTGAGEMLLVVVGGVYGTRQEAEDANASIVLGDLQGYYVVPVAQFQGFHEQVGDPGGFALVSAFRTEEGARVFAELVRSAGYPATVLSQRVRSLGGSYAGLGQEASPDGTGPLVGPVEASLP